MSVAIEKPILDYTYQGYLAKQFSAISKVNNYKQATAMQSSGKYSFDGKKWQIKPYEGFAVVSMVDANPENNELKQVLGSINSILTESLNQNQAYYILPTESHHQTIANTLSDQRYFENILHNNILESFPNMIGNAFDMIRLSSRNISIKMKMIGLNVFGTCIALLGIFENEEDYQSIISFREQFYNNQELNKINIKWTRPFIGHITLAYLGRELLLNEQIILASTICKINSSLDFSKAIFNINQAELRSYKDLSVFSFYNHYPIFNFLK